MNNISDILSQKGIPAVPAESTTLAEAPSQTPPGYEPLSESIATPHVLQHESTISPASSSSDDHGIPPKTDDQKQLDLLKTMIHDMKNQLDTMLRIVAGEQIAINNKIHPDSTMLETGERIIEGVFNGEAMVGSDGNTYPVPPNYASKSKMVEGDLLKLQITTRGSFVYKQIGPIARKRIVGELAGDGQNSQWHVVVNGRTYKILKASVTFYKAKPGDEVFLLVPEDGESLWGAVDSIVHK